MQKQFVLKALVLGFLSASAAKADIPNGGSAVFTHISGTQYKVSATFYRNCRTVPFSGTMRARLISTCTTLNITLTRSGIRNASQRCAGAVTCSPSNTIRPNDGFEAHTYEASIDFSQAPYSGLLSSSCCQVTFLAMRPGRSNSITSLQNPVSNGMGLTAVLQTCNLSAFSAGNSSAEIHTDFPFVVPSSQVTALSFQAKDADGDSLVYILTPAIDSNTFAKNYVSGFNFTSPITPYCLSGSTCAAVPSANPPRGFFLNRNTGDLIFQPVFGGETGVVVVQIWEYRKLPSGAYSFVGYSSHERQLAVTGSTGNNSPTLNPAATYTLCLNEKFCFRVKASDVADTRSDTTRLAWSDDIRGAAMRIVDSSAREREVEFCWTPDSNAAKKTFHFFSVWASDNRCPLPLQSRRTYTFTVLPKPATSLRFSTHSGSRLFYEVSNPSTMALMTASLLDPDGKSIILPNLKDTVRLLKPGKYILRAATIEPGKCLFEARDSVIMQGCVQAPIRGLSSQPVCRGSVLKLFPDTSNAKGTLSYRWTNRRNNTLGTADTLRITATRDTLLRLRTDDILGCFALDSILIKTYSPALSFKNPGINVCTENNGADLADITQVKPANARFSSFYSGLIVQDTAGRYRIARRVTLNGNRAWIRLETTDSLGCTARDSFSTNMLQSPVNTLQGETICGYNQSYPIFSRWLNADTVANAYLWRCYASNATNPATVLTRNLARLNAYGDYHFELTTINRNNQCSAKDSVSIRVAFFPAYDIDPNVPDLCEKSGEFDLNDIVTVYVPTPDVRWTALALDNNRNDPRVATALRAGRYLQTNAVGRWHLRFDEGSTGCVRRDSLFVTVQAAPKPNIGRDTSINIDGIKVLNAGAYSNYRWDNNSIERIRVVDPKAFGLGTHWLWVTVTDGNTGCEGTDSLQLTILPAGTGLSKALPDDLQVFPNPTAGNLNIILPGAFEAALYDVQGRLVVKSQKGNGKLQLETAALAGGHYTLQITRGKEVYSLPVLRR